MIQKLKSILVHIIPDIIIQKIKAKRVRDILNTNAPIKKRIILIGTPNHGNLGDQAITIAELNFLKDNLEGYHVIEIPLKLIEYVDNLKEIFSKYVTKDDIIICHGGGYMGIEWFNGEFMIRSVIKSFTRNRIIVFPQTIYYGETERGKEEFEKSKHIYDQHPDLHICARERASYQIMKAAYSKADVILAPDIVLSMNKSEPKFERKGALLCLRSDPESNLTEQDKEKIKLYVSKHFTDVDFTDTVIYSGFSKNQREQELNKKFDEFKHARLVITDRLHGMVFCAITGTPCIALSNYNYKVKGVYEWIENLNYIRYLDDYHEIPKYISELMNLKDCEYDNRSLMPYFEKIVELLK